MIARDIMQKKVLAVGPDMTLREAAKIFHEAKISGAPVVDPAGKLIGVLSQTDLARHRVRGLAGIKDKEAKEGSFWVPEQASGAAAAPERSSATIKVSEVMTKAVFSAPETAPVRDLMRMMVREKIHRVIVTSDGGRLSGIMTTMDVLRAVLHWLNRHAQDLED